MGPHKNIASENVDETSVENVEVAKKSWQRPTICRLNMRDTLIADGARDDYYEGAEGS